MITKIILKKIATYTETVELTNLRKVNFFFGSNGSGKTALSKLIANPENYPICDIEWENNTEIKRAVYNEDFVTSVFYQSKNFPGIFTIGEESKTIEEKIEKKNEEREKLEKKITSLNITLQEKKDNLQENRNNFKELCWNKIYEKYQSEFTDVFIGYRNSKEKFSECLLKEYSNNKSELREKEYLTNRYNLLFKEKREIIDELKVISEETLTQLQNLESNEIVKTKIIGRKDIDIAAMIEKLHNHDWVRQGKQYYEKNYDEKTESYICPFCQQATPYDFKQKLEEYFDEAYESQINKLDVLINGYKKMKDKEKITISKEKAQEFLEELLDEQDRISHELNQRFLKRKLKVLIEEKSGDFSIGRSWHFSPEIDGNVYIKGECRPGEFVEALITEVYENDLEGIVNEYT